MSSVLPHWVASDLNVSYWDLVVPGPASSLQSHLAAYLFLSLLLCPPAKSVRANILPVDSLIRVSVTVAYHPTILTGVRRERSGCVTQSPTKVMLMPAALAESKPMCASGSNLPNNIVLDKVKTNPTLKRAKPVCAL